MSDAKKIEVREAAQDNLKSKKPRRKIKVNRQPLFFAFAIIVLIFIAFIFLTKDHNPVPKNIRQSAKFTIYYPKGLSIKKNSFVLTNSNRLLTFLVTSRDTQVYVTEQSKPQYFDFADFDKGIKAPVTVSTAYGNATVGMLGGRMIGDLPATDSWVLISASPNTSPDELVAVLKRLQQD